MKSSSWSNPRIEIIKWYKCTLIIKTWYQNYVILIFVLRIVWQQYCKTKKKILKLKTNWNKNREISLNPIIHCKSFFMMLPKIYLKIRLVVFWGSFNCILNQRTSHADSSVFLNQTEKKNYSIIVLANEFTHFTRRKNVTLNLCRWFINLFIFKISNKCIIYVYYTSIGKSPGERAMGLCGFASKGFPMVMGFQWRRLEWFRILVVFLSHMDFLFVVVGLLFLGTFMPFFEFFMEEELTSRIKFLLWHPFNYPNFVM